MKKVPAWHSVSNYQSVLCVCFGFFYIQKTGNALRALGRMAMLSANRRSPSLSPTSTRSLSEVTRSESLDSEGREDFLDSSKGEPTDQDKISSKEKNSNGVLEKDVCELSSREGSLEAASKPEEEKAETSDCGEMLDSLESINHQDVIDTIHEEEETRITEEENQFENERNIEESRVDSKVRNINDYSAHETVHVKADAIKRVHYDVSPVEDDQTNEAVKSEFIKENYSKGADKNSLSLDIKKLQLNEPRKNGKMDYEKIIHRGINELAGLKASKDVALDHDPLKRSFRTFNSQFGGL